MRVMISSCTVSGTSNSALAARWTSSTFMAPPADGRSSTVRKPCTRHDKSSAEQPEPVAGERHGWAGYRVDVRHRRPSWRRRRSGSADRPPWLTPPALAHSARHGRHPAPERFTRSAERDARACKGGAAGDPVVGRATLRMSADRRCLARGAIFGLRIEDGSGPEPKKRPVATARRQRGSL